VEDAYTVGNARMEYETEDSRYLIGVWVKNISGTEYRTFNGPITGNGYTLQQFGRPRWFGVSFRVNF
jgi:outer membrane receptor protein involved in Fe transport